MHHNIDFFYFIINVFIIISIVSLGILIRWINSTLIDVVFFQVMVLQWVQIYELVNVFWTKKQFLRQNSLTNDNVDNQLRLNEIPIQLYKKYLQL